MRQPPTAGEIDYARRRPRSRPKASGIARWHLRRAAARVTQIRRRLRYLAETGRLETESALFLPPESRQDESEGVVRYLTSSGAVPKPQIGSYGEICNGSVRRNLTSALSDSVP